MIDTIIHIIERLGPYVTIPLLCVAVGAATFFVTLWNLLTGGGPRAGAGADAPRLYDRLYYALQLFKVAGWTGFPAGFLLETVSGTSLDGGRLILILMVPLFIATGLQMLVRGEMMNRAARHLAKAGPWWQRLFYRMWVIRFAYATPMQRTLLACLGLAGGLAVIAVCLPQMPDALAQIKAGSLAIIDLVAAPTDAAPPG